VSFRAWYDIVRERVPALLDQYLPAEVLAFQSSSDVSAKTELEAYLIGSFGSSQRLDYGTGHELSFLAFLGCIWKLGAFPASQDGEQERGIVLGVIEPYLVLTRRLILTYTLEPAGSHGVWGLDDHSFLPYVFGSAQFSPAIVTPADVAAEGSLPSAPHPGDVAKAPAVARERTRNMYFSAIGFIYDVKKGPFWEHSNILYDVSGVKAGWAKINKVGTSQRLQLIWKPYI
jgi:serine/threonine-protein phosphatase 2A activator